MTMNNGRYEKNGWDSPFYQNKSGSARIPGNMRFNRNHGISLEEGNRSPEGKAIIVGANGDCFTGVVVGLPLSLLAWTMVVVLIYLAIH